MANKILDRLEGLEDYLTAYGLDHIDKIDRYKSGNGSYYVLGIKLNNGLIGLLDVCNVPDNFMNSNNGTDYQWSMQNDSCGDIEESWWEKIKMDSFSDGFTIPGHPEYE